MAEDERLKLIASTIEALRPLVRNDGGDLELVAVKGSRVEVRLSGQCLSCALAVQTLGGIRRKLMQVLDTSVMVVPHQSWASGKQKGRLRDPLYDDPVLALRFAACQQRRPPRRRRQDGGGYGYYPATACP